MTRGEEREKEGEEGNDESTTTTTGPNRGGQLTNFSSEIQYTRTASIPLLPFLQG